MILRNQGLQLWLQSLWRILILIIMVKIKLKSSMNNQKNFTGKIKGVSPAIWIVAILSAISLYLY